MSLAHQSRRLSVPPLVHLKGQGCGSLGGGSVVEQIFNPLRITSTPSLGFQFPSTVTPPLQGEISALIKKGAVELAPPSPWFYSHVFEVMKASGLWRPIIGLSILNKFVCQSRFKMETNRSVLNAIQRDDKMFSIDLKDAYFQVPVHPESRKYLRFAAFSKVFQFKVLCFSLSLAPQVFTRFMALVSTILHRLGVQILSYLDH